MRIYLDTSVFLKRFNEENGSDIIRKIFAKCQESKITLVISQWTLGESISTLDRACRRRILSFDEMNSLVIEMLLLIQELQRRGHLVLIEIDSELITQSWAFIRFNHLSADDSLHAICAMIGKSDVFLMEDDYFSKMLTNPDENAPEDTPTPRIAFNVLDMGNPEDTKKLDEIIRLA